MKIRPSPTPPSPTTRPQTATVGRTETRTQTETGLPEGLTPRGREGTSAHRTGRTLTERGRRTSRGAPRSKEVGRVVGPPLRSAVALGLYAPSPTWVRDALHLLPPAPRVVPPTLRSTGVAGPRVVTACETVDVDTPVEERPVLAPVSGPVSLSTHTVHDIGHGRDSRPSRTTTRLHSTDGTRVRTDSLRTGKDPQGRDPRRSGISLPP